MLGLLLKNRLNILFLGYTRDEIKKKIGRIIGTFLGIAIFSLILYYSARFFTFIYNRLDTGLANTIFDIALDYIFLVVFIFIIFTGIATSLYILYLSKDLELLLSIPIKYRTVFIYKYIEALVTNSYLFFIAIMPILISFGITSKLPMAYYPSMIIVFISVVSIPTSLGVLTGMAAVRLINPNRAKEILAFIGGLFGLLIWLSTQLIARFGENMAPQLKSMSIEDIKAYITAVFDKPFLKFFPSTWGSNTLFYLHNGNYKEFGLNFILITAVSALLIFLCIVISQRIYYTGWSNSSQVAARTGSRRVKIKIEVNTDEKGKYGYGLFSGVNYFILKDFKILLRDARRLLNIFLPMFMFTFLFFWSFSRSINDSGEINFFLPLKIILFLFLPLAIIGLVNSNISANNIGSEGLQFWILKVSPLQPKIILRTKIIFSSILTIFCGIIIMTIFYFVFKPGLSYLILGLILLILFSWGESIIGTSVGTFFPVFKPSQSSNKNNISFIGGMLNLMLFLLYILIFAGIAIGILYLANYLNWSSLISFPVIIALELILDIILYNTLVNLSTYRLNALEWKY